MLKNSIYVKEIRPEDTHPLRIAVLREGNTQNIIFDGDNDTDTFHLGAMFYGSTIGIASFYKRSPPEELNMIKDKQCYQLRGMGVHPEYRGLDAASKLLSEGEKMIVANHGPDSAVWCNARTGAMGFYRKKGYEAVGEEFQVLDVGPHYLMYKVITE
jgi:ribosomal protein S18 acetylase RimI-like enzyme